jgi:hypothetical protein
LLHAKKIIHVPVLLQIQAAHCPARQLPLAWVSKQKAMQRAHAITRLQQFQADPLWDGPVTCNLNGSKKTWGASVPLFFAQTEFFICAFYLNKRYLIFTLQILLMKKFLSAALLCTLGFLWLGSCSKGDPNPLKDWTCTCFIVKKIDSAHIILDTQSILEAKMEQSLAATYCSNSQKSYTDTMGSSAKCSIK